jgi:acyl dehydratase
MAVSRRYALRQGPVIRALISAAVVALRKDRPPPSALPGPRLTETVPARPDDLVRDYVRACGGDPSSYKGVVPAHLFPQWGFPLLARSLRAIPYDLRKVLNGGCRIELHRPLPAGEPLNLEAWLEDIDDNGSRAVIENRITTGTASSPGAIDAWMYAVVPLKKADGTKKERPRVPADAHELARWKIEPRHAMDFALLTGDFNPVHWVPAYARAAGFRSTILHGFATLARAIEGLNKARFAGDASRLRSIDVKFVRPLVLPARVGLYVRGNEVFVGTAPDGPAYLTGVFDG